MLTENHPQAYKKKCTIFNFVGAEVISQAVTEQLLRCSAGPKWHCQGTSKRVINGPGPQDFRSVE